MIYTVTLNPSIDYVMECEKIEEGKLNRSRNEKIFAGGKGINVSVMLNNLGLKSMATGFAAGFTGRELVNIVESQNIRQSFVFVENSFTRINVKIKGEIETEINGEGPFVSKEDFNRLLECFNGLKSDDLVIMSGSVPKSEVKNIYDAMAERLCVKGIRFIADTTGENLKSVLKYRPLMVKPNEAELEELFNYEINSIEEIISCAGKLKLLGAENVLVSMGEKGAALITSDGEALLCGTPKGKKVNTVGSGDSMVAGWTAGIINYGKAEEALALSVACGSASAFCEGLASKEQVMTLYNDVKNMVVKGVDEKCGLQI